MLTSPTSQCLFTQQGSCIGFLGPWSFHVSWNLCFHPCFINFLFRMWIKAALLLQIDPPDPGDASVTQNLMTSRVLQNCQGIFCNLFCYILLQLHFLLQQFDWNHVWLSSGVSDCSWSLFTDLLGPDSQTWGTRNWPTVLQKPFARDAALRIAFLPWPRASLDPAMSKSRANDPINH